VLVIGRFLAQLEALAQALGAPLLTGETPFSEREKLLKDFRSGKDPLLVVSNVANFSLDLPEASVAIEVSGTFGSRQEEAQRLGRILRPKEDGRPAHFYALVSSDTSEQQFAILRQRFLTEQGYRYRIVRYGEETAPSAGALVIPLAEARRRLRGGAQDV
jgi:DNA excision repair protein ERCC-3